MLTRHDYEKVHGIRNASDITSVRSIPAKTAPVEPVEPVVVQVGADPSPFRPEVSPTILAPSMRSPMFASTAARPGAISVEAGYANQVPLERQGPISMTTGNRIYAQPTLGLTSTIPASMTVPYAAVSRLAPAAGIASPFTRRSGVAMPDWATNVYTQTQWDRMSATDRQRLIDQHAPGAAMPSWATEVFTAQQWNGMTPSQRQDAVTAYQRSSQPGIGAQLLALGAGLGQQAIQGYLAYNQAERDHALAAMQAETQRQLAAAQATGSRQDPAVAQMMQQMMTMVTQLQTGQSRSTAETPTPKKDEGLSTGAIVAIAVGGVVVLGGVAFLAMRRRNNPSRRRRGRSRRSR